MTLNDPLPTLGLAHFITQANPLALAVLGLLLTLSVASWYQILAKTWQGLLGLGQPGHGSLDQVAGPVGEALIMTGLGLAVAIPAVLAYNAFNRANRVLIDRLEGFAQDLLSFLVTDRRDGEAPAILADSGGARP